ncbi:hypothetical protein B0T26DRAFT_262625 [Lasiosphaeria miniovina]|uniref:DUF7082 domain-containing protein n=1 Tax=Lasiosphaeria miniovina TaxID=1954250 RepID=A0AA40AWZ0_9PEZI|nr:uncharacterized protein B0T26DRAFT_262625 [Lasiosphaeria miniovina]KAK0723535.1 hypothetical protein B0T26DRAFT_262625 [Lasiosphaeria miniovina]
MSVARFDQPAYKVFEPGYRTRRTIIVDEQVESPETLTIRLEEEAARNGGDLCGGSPTGLLPMSYKAQPSQLHDSSYPPYSSQTFSSENAASQMNQMAFAANNTATGQYLGPQTASGPALDVISCQPSSGSYGTKITLKVRSQYDLASGAISAHDPFVSVLFGSQRCPAQVTRGSRDGNSACTYTVTAEAPQFQTTSCPSLSNVPLTLLVEGTNGEEVARVNSAGVFSYHGGHGAAAGSVVVGGSADTSTPDLESPRTRSPVPRPSPPNQTLKVDTKTASLPSHHGLPSDSDTNTYGFPPVVSAATSAASQAHAHVQPDFAFSQGSSMLGPYRTEPPSYTDQYSRAPLLRSPHGSPWSPFGNHMDTIQSSARAVPAHSNGLARPSLNPIHHSNSSTPQLVRTSTISQSPNAGPSGYNPYILFQTKASLNIVGDLESMKENWTHEEWENRRRIVLFKKQQNGNVLTTSFKPVSVSERPPGSICISCIWWQEKNDCFVTSVDTIHLLEQLVAAPKKFAVDEKNRIRRNLEGFHPLTVSKSKFDSEEFFKLIMGFGNPKPRNIEKDVKVFPWKVLSQALMKIISKYSAPSSGNFPPPASVSSSYPTLPPTPVSASSASAADPLMATAYMGSGHHQHHAESGPSPRPLSGGSASWAAYGGPVKTMSPAMKLETISSPIPTSGPMTSGPIPTSGLRISTLPAVYDSRGSLQSITSPYNMPSSAHSGQYHGQGGYSQPGVPVTQSQTRSWEGYAVADAYSTQSNHPHSQVYGAGPYGEGTQRA